MSDTKPIFPTIGIGASAGGIRALEGLFRGMPTPIGAAFVIVTHLNPDRASVLHEIVARYTKMPVEPARDDTEVQPDHVYVLPENAVIGIQNGRLRVHPADASHRERKPIDLFLSTLAKDQEERAGAIILSGGDGDGTLGVKAVKARGGLTMAQTGDGSAPQHPDMPDSAINSGLVDFAIPVEEMPEKIAQFAQGLESMERFVDRGNEDERQRGILQRIYALLRSQTGHDFRGYKTKTFGRRVHRRMQVLQLSTVESYAERLRQEPSEVAALFRDLLIGVTSFFRDEAAFEALRTLVIPKIFEGRGADDVVRAWVPGCATGEEVYSLAVLMREHMATLDAVPKVQIFATDIDEAALGAARAARYPEALLEGVSDDRKSRFFTRDGSAYVVNKEVRDLCIFSPHSVVRDPPFSRMDLVSCRNLLIYLGPDIQNQVIPMFHYSLRPSGYLFLGTSENIGHYSDLFAPVDKKNRVFRAREDVAGPVHLPMMLNHMRPVPFSEPVRSGKMPALAPLRHRVETQVLERHAPAHLVVNAEGDVVYYSTRTGRYLEAAQGAPSRQLLAMARKGLRLDLRVALREALETRHVIERENIAVDTDEDRVQLVTVTVEPLAEGADEEPLFLVMFADKGAVSQGDAVSPAGGDQDGSVAHLECELHETRERLQSVVEEYETALEELRSSNEELVSVNEELQSTNEELEASKEELQSLNEELQTVNFELSQKVDALDRANADLRNLFDSTQIATIFLDHNLVIRNFTPPARGLFNIRESDCGRPLTDFSSRIVYPELHDDIRAAFSTGKPGERKIASEDAKTRFLARLRPYRSFEGKVEGVVVTLVDVTELAEAHRRQRILIAELNHRVKNMLTVVLGIIRQTTKSETSIEGIREALVSRIESMARSFELLSREDWTEAQVDAIVRQELEPFGNSRAVIEGPDIRLQPKQALSLGMVIHELTTNAAKHGALSSSEGTVSVRWSRADGDDGGSCMRLNWQEQDGPAIGESGTDGFGLRLVEKETSYGLGGAAKLDWRPDGLVVDLEFPITR